MHATMCWFVRLTMTGSILGANFVIFSLELWHILGEEACTFLGITSCGPVGI